MPNAIEPLAGLLPSDVIPHLEQMNMPYLGYHFLRETLTSTLLGESESPILFWMGKDIGKRIPIESPVGLVLPFIRLGLGKLELADDSSDHCRFTLTHSVYNFLPIERLKRSLSLECGIIAGAMSRWLGKKVKTQLRLTAGKNGKITEAQITVLL
jgi:hypothetical protein